MATSSAVKNEAQAAQIETYEECEKGKRVFKMTPRGGRMAKGLRMVNHTESPHLPPQSRQSNWRPAGVPQST